jgi:hypothetical protein
MCILLWMQIRIVRASIFHLHDHVFDSDCGTFHDTYREKSQSSLYRKSFIFPNSLVSSHRECWQDGLGLTQTVSSAVYVRRKKIPVVPVSYREKIRVGRSEIIFLKYFFHGFFNNYSVTTDAILAAARNHKEKIGSHGQSRWKNNRVGRKK